MRSLRAFIQDSFQGSGSRLPMNAMARSVIVAAVVPSPASLDEVDDLQATANRLLGVPVLFTESGLLGSEYSERTAHVVELPIDEWDPTQGPHLIDLLNAPNSDESVVLVRACGVAPERPRRLWTAP